VFASPRFGSHEAAGPFAQIVVEDEFAGREDHGLGKIAIAALIVNGERGESVDLVTPQVDTNRLIGGGREHVDDGPSLGYFATMLHDLFASVPHVHETSNELGRIEDRALAHNDGFGLRRLRSELLQECAHARDDDSRRSVGFAESPDHFESSAHGLDTWAHTFERKCLPGRKEDDIVGRNERHEVIEQLTGHGAGRARHHEWTASREFGQGGDSDGSRRIGNGQYSVG